ncbi:MAG: DUF3221 domain-containing protein [Lachnospiraceae bacterium]|nr:DUF3221 domain-containing protein [Lachnospiraceae bacterium]
MKKSRLFIVGILCILAVMVGCGKEERSSMIGYYLEMKDGSHFIISEEAGPIVMSNQSDQQTLFDDLKTGDKIEITYDSIKETYPAGTGVYSCKLLESGTIDNISKDILSNLTEMGWIPVTE